MADQGLYSANTALDELLRPYRNAFSLLSPALLDTPIITKADDWHSRKSVSHLPSWAMSSQRESFPYAWAMQPL